MLLDANQWSPLHDELRDLKGSARYVPNHGNAGDALIAAATWQLFDDLAIYPRISDVSEIGAGDDVIYAGGGNLVPEYNACRVFLERSLEVGVRRALILPHTVRGHEQLLRKLGDHFTIACRDDESISWLTACGTGAKIIKVPDMALRMNVDQLLGRCKGADFRIGAARDLITTGMWRSYLRWRVTLLGLSLQRHEIMRILRTDVESVPGVKGRAVWDISNLYISHFHKRSECDLIARDMMVFLQEARAVITNRLHVGVAAALVGCRVTYLDNSYGKIGAVYRSYLTGIPTISFAEATQGG